MHASLSVDGVAWATRVERTDIGTGSVERLLDTSVRQVRGGARGALGLGRRVEGSLVRSSRCDKDGSENVLVDLHGTLRLWVEQVGQEEEFDSVVLSYEGSVKT